MKLILASSSRYRKALLERLHLDFECFAPHIDESPIPGEPHETLVKRLAEEKALEAQKTYPGAICIGSDTIASFQDTILGKPGNFENAVKQLQSMSGQTVEFLTGVCVVGPHGTPVLNDMVPTSVRFKSLTDDMIHHYCEREAPYHSSGSFKSETIACALTEQIRSEDPTAIIGLPLIRLASMLRNVGIQVL